MRNKIEKDISELVINIVLLLYRGDLVKNKIIYIFLNGQK